MFVMCPREDTVDVWTAPRPLSSECLSIFSLHVVFVYRADWKFVSVNVSRELL